MTKVLSLIILSLSLVLLENSAQADRQKGFPIPPHDYVVVCTKGGKTTVEPYAFHEARVQRGILPDTFDPQLHYEKVLDAAIDRLRPYSEVHAEILSGLKNGQPLKNTKFVENIDIVADESETIPPPLEAGCQIKKLYSYRPPQLPYDFVFNATLWNALSNVGKASVLTNILFHSCSGKFREGDYPYQRGEVCLAYWNESEIRKITALLYSSKLRSLSARDWFSELSSVRTDWVVYQGLALKISGAEFYEETGSLRSANAYKEHRSTILSERVYLKNLVRFYPNGAVHWLTATDARNSDAQSSYSYSYSSSNDGGIRVQGGEVRLSPECEAEFSQDQKLIQGCISDAQLRTFGYDLYISGHTTFYPSGYLQTAQGRGLIDLSQRIGIAGVISTESRKLHFDSDGSIMDGVLAGRLKIHTQNADFELAPEYFEAYPQGGIKLATLATDTNAPDCTGAIRHFSAGSIIQFNEAGVPCRSRKQ